MSTGRWLSRDPEEEDGGGNLFCWVSNDGVNHSDALGLKVLLVSVARDRTLPGKPYSRKAAEVNAIQQHYLQDCLWRCLECSGKDIPTVRLAYNQSLLLDVPKGKIWHIGNKDEEALMQTNWNALGGVRISIPVFWTRDSIAEEGSGKPGDAAGVGYFNKGIILSLFHWHPIRNLLAHEVGHFAGYRGDAPDGHSSAPQNVMSYGGGNDPDTQYCDKVISIAR